MSFFGNLLKIIAIGAFFIATGPFSFGLTAAIRSVIGYGGIVIGYLGSLIDKPQLLTDRQKIIIGTTLEPSTPVPAVYGRAKVGAIVADWFLDLDTTYPALANALYYVAVLCHGSQDGNGVALVEEIWLDQRRAITATSGRIWPYKLLTSNHRVFLGSTTQNVGGTAFYSVAENPTGQGIKAPSAVAGSGWSATTDTGKGICCVGFVFVNVDSSTFSQTAISISTSSVANPTVITTSTAHGFTSGDSVRIASHAGSTPSLNAEWVITVTGTTTFTIPANVTVGGSGGNVRRFSEGPVFRGPPSIAAIVQGNRIFDTRTSVWVDAGDNPAMVIRDYLLAPIYGCGYAQVFLNEQSFKDMADYCDTLIKHVVSAPITVSTSSVANPSVITTASPHGLVTGDLARIAGHSGSTPAINSDYTVTKTGDSTFTIPVNVTVGGTGGTVVKLVQIKRHTCNGVLDTSRPTGDNLQELLSSCRGNLVWEQGQFKLTIRSELVASPTLTLSPSNIIGEWAFRNAGQEEKWNLIKASYVEPANGEFKVQQVQWPRVGTTNAYLTADNQFQNTLELNLPFVNDQLQAQMIAQITLNEARKGISCSVRCTEEVLSVSVGDRVYVTHPTPGWTAKEFWVTGLQLLPDTTVNVSLQEYDAVAYSLDTMDDRRSFPATTLDSIFVVPSPGTVTITGMTPQGIKISWDAVSYGMIDFYEVQARFTSAGEDYVTIERIRVTEQRQAIAPLARPGQTWDARVRVVNVVGWPSNWVDASQFAFPVPPPVSPGLGQATWVGFAPTVTIPPAPPSLSSVGRSSSGGDECSDTVPDKGNWMHHVTWTTTGADDTNFQVDISIARDSGAADFTEVAATGLTTASSSYDHNTGVQGNVNGSSDPLVNYAEYKVKIVRKSDSSVTSFLTTSQGTLTTYSDECLPL